MYPKVCSCEKGFLFVIELEYSAASCFVVSLFSWDSTCQLAPLDIIDKCHPQERPHQITVLFISAIAKVGNGGNISFQCPTKLYNTQRTGQYTLIEQSNVLLKQSAGPDCALPNYTTTIHYTLKSEQTRMFEFDIHCLWFHLPK